MNLLEKIDQYLNEENTPFFWNTLIDNLNRKYKGHKMMLQERKNNVHSVSMVSGFDLPKELVGIVKKTMTQLTKNSEITSKAIALTSDEWTKAAKALHLDTE